MHAFVILKLIEIDPNNKFGIYLTETEFYALLIILVANLIYDYFKYNSENSVFNVQRMKSDFN